MTQKWNLQDIRPAEPRPPRRQTPPPTVIRNQGDMRPPTTDNGESGTVTINRQPSTRHEQPRPFASRLPHDENEIEEEESELYDERVPVIDGRKRNRTHLIIAVCLFFVITGLGIAISYATGGATITVYPKERTMNVNAEFTAYKEARPNELSYEILTLEATGERQVEASGQQTVTTQATGLLEIKKNTEGAERLIKNTRFADASGKIFRIEESVVVPGAVKDSSGTLVPGSIQAKVFADEAGEGYNLPAGTQFKVPGFEEGGYTELYNAISATNGTAFTGGFNGPQFVIDEGELATARQSLQMELRDTLLAKAESERPANFTSFPGAVAITYNQLPPVQYGDNLVTIKEQAVLQIPLFKSDDFASFIAKESIVGYEGEGVRIDNISDLIFAYTNPTTSQSVIANEESLRFKITGEPNIVWTYDEGKLKVELTGKQKTAIPNIMKSYTGIERSEVRVRPIWERSMPDDMDDIEVIESLKADVN